MTSPQEPDIQAASIEMLTFALGANIGDVAASPSPNPARRVLAVMDELARRGRLEGFLSKLNPAMAGAVAMSYNAARVRLKFGGN